MPGKCTENPLLRFVELIGIRGVAIKRFESYLMGIEMNSWCKNNSTLLNVSKAKYINFTLKGFHFKQSISYHNEQYNQFDKCECPIMEKVRCFKYPGIVLDVKLAWREHVLKLQTSIKSQTRNIIFLEINVIQNYSNIYNVLSSTV